MTTLVLHLNRRIALLLSGVLLVVGACGTADSADLTPEGLHLVATTAVLGDIVAKVAGDDVEVSILINRDQDPHSFSPSASDLGLLSRADLVVANGLSLEAGIIDALEAAEAENVPVIRIAELVEPIPFSGAAAVTGGLDPHFWHDPTRMVIAADLLASALSELDPAASAQWHQNAATIGAEIARTHERVTQILSAVEPGDRKLVTNHDSLSYFAARYGFEVVATVIPGAASVGSPSAADLAELVTTLRQTKVKAVFAETTRSDELARAVAAELGHDVAVVRLHTAGLGPAGSRAESYVGMLVENAELIVAGLRR